MKVRAWMWTTLLCGMLALATGVAPRALADPLPDATGRRLVYLLRDANLVGTDPAPGTPPHGVIHGNLKDKSGALVGTFDVVLVGTFSAQPGGDTTAILNAVATLPEGTISAQGVAVLGDSTPPFTLAVTGGTARYRRATGVVEVTPSQNDGEARLVYRLTP